MSAECVREEALTAQLGPAIAGVGEQMDPSEPVVLWRICKPKPKVNQFE